MRANVAISKNRKAWDEIKKNLKAQKNIVEVGFFDGEMHTTKGITIAQVAQFNEEGGISSGVFKGSYVPSRPFMRKALSSFVEQSLRKRYIPMVHRVAIGAMTWDDLNNLIAEEIKESIRTSIREWTTPPNSPATISLKGFNNPLIETGTMLNSIRYRLKGKING